MEILRLGTRGSKLALWQAEHVKNALEAAIPGLQVEIHIIKTTGDKILDVALSKIGDKGLFTREIEKELLEEKIDIAVHSMKDLPSQLEEGFCIGAVLPRENPQDVLISDIKGRLIDLPDGAVLGTSSLRRKAQIKSVRPDIQLVDLRGNVETRIRKMRDEGMDGIILAYAGVKRLGYESLVSDYLDYDLVMPAVGQGAIAVEMRAMDPEVFNIIKLINDEQTRIEVEAERSFLAELEGGCQVPIAAAAFIKGNSLFLQGLVATLDGQNILRAELSGNKEQAVQLGQDLGRHLLAAGAGRILDKIRQMGANE